MRRGAIYRTIGASDRCSALTDDRVVRAVVDLVDSAVTSWFLGAPDENGVVVSGPTPSPPEESDVHVSALRPAGLKPEDAAIQVNLALVAAGLDCRGGLRR